MKEGAWKIPVLEVPSYLLDKKRKSVKVEETGLKKYLKAVYDITEDVKKMEAARKWFVAPPLAKKLPISGF